MRHFPLLGSVFRSSIKQQRYAAEHQNAPPETAHAQERQLPNRVGILVNSQVVQTFPTTSHIKNRPQTTAIPKKVHLTSPEKDNLSVCSESFDENLIDKLSQHTQAAKFESTNERVEGPRVFYRKFLPPTAPPSTSNFSQLQEMLNRLLQADVTNDPVVQHEAYETIFLEVIRQYFIECSAQGRLLDKCRLFFSSVNKYIPKLKARYVSELQSLWKQIEDNRKFSEKMKCEIKPMEEKRDSLNGVLNDLKTDFALLAKHFDGLSTSIIVTGKEVDSLKQASLKIDSRIAQKNQDLIKLNEELRMLDEVSAKCTTDTVVVAEKLKALIAEQTSLKERVSAETKILSKKRQQYKQLCSEMQQLEKAFEEEKNAIKLIDISIQADLNSKANRSATVEEAKRNHIQKQRRTKGDPLANIFETLEQGSKDLVFPPEGIKIATYDDFAQLKQYIMDNNDKFQMSQAEIDEAEKGLFYNENANPAFLKLFSSRIISGCIDSAVRKVPLTETGSQTQARVLNSSSKQSTLPSSLAGAVKFTRLIPADYSQREPQNIPWMIKNIRNIYDEKLQADIKCLEERKPLISLAEFIIGFSKKHNKLDFLAYQFCWDVFNTSTFFVRANTEIQMFYDALLETIDVEQLCFMLICRDLILKVGAVVSTKTDEQTEQITDFYMSQDQLEPALRKWWKHRYNDHLYPRLMTLAVARPAIHLEAMKRYVSMSDILSVMVDEFQRDEIDRMYELLVSTRITPRINQTDFLALMKALVPQITDTDCDRFFRATVTKSLNRREISKEDFGTEFLNGSILFMHDEAPQVDVKQEELLETIINQWENKRETLTLMVNYFEGIALEQSDDLKLRSQVSDAQRYLLMMEHSLSIRNSQEACFNYFHLIFSLDILFHSLSFGCEDSEASLVSLECCIKEYWLDSVFVNPNFTDRF